MEKWRLFAWVTKSIKYRLMGCEVCLKIFDGSQISPLLFFLAPVLRFAQKQKKYLQITWKSNSCVKVWHSTMTSISGGKFGLKTDCNVASNCSQEKYLYQASKWSVAVSIWHNINNRRYCLGSCQQVVPLLEDLVDKKYQTISRRR